jgi:hypothetical protein
MKVYNLLQEKAGKFLSRFYGLLGRRRAGEIQRAFLSLWFFSNTNVSYFGIMCPGTPS